jgi:hypothetical protein
MDTGAGMDMVTGTAGMTIMGLGGVVVVGAAGIRGTVSMSPQAMATMLTPTAVTPQATAGIRAPMTTAIRTS